jgi:hypothetical protein
MLFVPEHARGRLLYDPSTFHQTPPMKSSNDYPTTLRETNTISANPSVTTIHSIDLGKTPRRDRPKRRD